MINQAFILCAGKATRMHPDTLTKPKCLLEIKGKTVIDHILDWLKPYVNDIIINLHWQADTVPRRENIYYSVEKELLGTAGGIRNCYDRLQEQFYIIYGDILTNMDLARLGEFHIQNKAVLTMASHRVNNPQDGGVIIGESRISQFIEKPKNPPTNLINAGILVCDREIFCRDVTDMAELISLLIKSNSVYHQEILPGEWVVDIGIRDNYVKMQ